MERRIYITVKPTQAGMISNSASVASPTPDYNLANNDCGHRRLPHHLEAVVLPCG